MNQEMQYTHTYTSITSVIVYDIAKLSKKIDQNNRKINSDIANLSNKVDDLTDKLTVLIDALTLIDQKVSEKNDKLQGNL